jgi:tripartite-type tricarboxylate transporter receptor subunit TctC
MRLGFIAIAAAALVPFAAGAQDSFPSKPIRFIVGAAPGGANDIMARTIAGGMKLSQPVVVENQAGAAATISAATVAKSAPDGHTLLLVSQSVLTVSPIINKITTYDSMKDFTGVALFGSAPLVLVVHPSNPAKSVQDIVAMAKAKPGELSFGSGGVGTTPFMAGTLLGLMTGTKYTSIPFKGEQPAMTEIMGGRLTMIARLNAEVRRVLEQPDVKERLHGMGFTLSSLSAEEFTRFIRAEHEKWSKVIRDADIKAE